MVEVVSHLQNELNMLEAFRVWVKTQLTTVPEENWFIPIGPGKWTLHQLLGHLVFWDQYTLEEMAPKMKDGSVLYFIEIQKLNDQSKKFSESIGSQSEMIESFLEKRGHLIDYFSTHADENLSFTVDDRPCSQAAYLHIFTHHDGEHKEQIIAFLEG